MGMQTRPKTSWELRAEKAESSLSAVRALIQQWQKQIAADVAEKAQLRSRDEWEYEQSLRFRIERQQQCVMDLIALCPAPAAEEEAR